jgi:RNA polymerase sigma-70 factor, ECF subfamily
VVESSSTSWRRGDMRRRRQFSAQDATPVETVPVCSVHNIAAIIPDRRDAPWNHFAVRRVHGPDIVTTSKDAFETQVLALLGPLHGVAKRLTKNDADAEDLVAESITRAWRARDSLVDKGAFRAWMFRILNNTYISERRKVLARPREELLVEESYEEGAFSIFERLHQPFLLWLANPEQEFLDKLLREDLDRALAALPEHHRIVVVLADVEGLKYGEIAETLDVPVGTVRSRLARARGALQRALWSVAQDRGLQTSGTSGA